MADEINKFGDPYENELFDKKGYSIELQHLPSGESVKFKAFLTQFEDQFSSEWSTERAFGRMDPIRSFRGTQRIISLGWDVVADRLEEAQHNLTKCSKLLSMLYPSYDDMGDSSSNQTVSGPADTTVEDAAEGEPLKPAKTTAARITPNNAATIKAAPLFRLKFANLIQSAQYGASTGSPDIRQGLVGSIDGLTYAPDLDQGLFDPEPGILYPQTIKLAFSFYVAHEHPLSWTNKKFWKPDDPGDSTFPRAVVKKKE